MDFKKVIHDTFKNNVDIIKSRYNSSKMVFTFLLLVFFLNYFFVWARFFDEYFTKSLSISYVLLLFSAIIFFSFFVLYKLEIKKEIKIALISLITIFWIVFLIPIF